jgi:hypothetical protein
MALTPPDVILLGSIQESSVTIVETFLSGSSPYDGVYLTFRTQFDIVPQTGGWPDPNQANLNVFNANDIEVGWKFNLPTGKIYDVVAVTASGDYSASIDLRDTNLREFINSVLDPPSNFPEAGLYGILVPTVNGIPSLSNLTLNQGYFPLASYWSDDIMAHSITSLAASGSGGGGTGSVTINNNVDNYLITATGTANTLNGESSLRYDGTGLIIGASGSAQALLQISGSSDLLLIKNGSDNGIKVNNEGVLQFLSQSSVPTAVGGGIYYSGSAFYVGID